jgi:drug/metabolite transporter (DMT)-like permease
MKIGKFVPFLSMLGATMLLATSGVFIKLASLPAPLMAWFRTSVPLMALVLLYLTGTLSKRGPGRPSRRILLGSFLNGVRLLLFFAGYLFTSVSNGVIILFSWPVFAALFGALFLGEKIELRNMLLLFVAFVGIFIVYSQSGFQLSDDDFIGMSLLLISSAIYAGTVIIFKSVSLRYDQVATTFYQNLVPALMFFPAVFIYRPFPTGYPLLYALIYAFFIGLIAFLLFFTALKHLSASLTAHLSYMEVVGALSLSVIILGDQLTWNKIVGGSMILFSVLFVSRRNKNIGAQDKGPETDIEEGEESRGKVVKDY